MLKTCTKCGQSKDETEFYPKYTPQRPDARFARCKTCVQDHQKLKRVEQGDIINAQRRTRAATRRDIMNGLARAWWGKNAEQINVTRRRRRAEDEAHRETLNGQVRALRRRHLERYRAQDRAHYSATAESHRARERARYAANAAVYRLRLRLTRVTDPLRFRVYDLIHRARRNARKRGHPDTFTPADLARLRHYWHYACAVCGNEEGFYWTLALDHWIPLKSPDCPGTVPTNIVLLCDGVGGCNTTKGARLPAAWLQERVGPSQAAAILRKIDTYFALVGGP